MLDRLLDPDAAAALPHAELQRRLEKLAKINAALMQRVERSMDQQANAYSLFQTAIGLESQVRLKTEELKSALHGLESVNDELTLARDAAESANRIKTRFFTAVGHDLLQPLHAARLSLSAVVETERIVDQRHLLDQIDHALSSIEELLRTILDISKLEAGVMKPSLQPIVLETLFQSLALDLEPLARARNLVMTRRPTDLAVLSDPLMLRRIVQNLMVNAVRYTAKGGVKLAARRRGDTVAIEVWDTGPGIPEAERDRIFEEFQRGSASERAGGGFGLGLSIVQRMAQALDHRIEVCSRVGHGTRFRVVAPLTNPPQVAREVSPPASPQQVYGFEGVRVVVIDNDEAVLMAMRTLLDRWSCDCRLASDLGGLEAILADTGFAPQIVLADYHLDHGRTGLEAVRRLRQAAGSDVPSVIITADRSPAIAEAAQQVGCELLCKPIRPAELRALMLHLLS